MAGTVQLGDELASATFSSACHDGDQAPPHSTPLPLPVEQLEEAFLVARAPPVARNPVAPGLRLMHAPAVLKFFQEKAPFDPDTLVDWLGIQTNMSMDDCSVIGRYFAVQPSRYFACARHRRLAWHTPPGTEIRGIMPVVDDEYPQLQAALNAALASDGRNFLAVELGAWYGPWAMRAAAAARQVINLNPKPLTLNPKP